MNCEWCKNEFHKTRKGTRFCSHSCSGFAYRKAKRNKTGLCIECNEPIFNTSKRCRKCNYKARRESTKNIKCKCIICNKDYIYKKHGQGNTYNKCVSCRCNEYKKKRKREYVNLKGGQCLICGYDRCNQALTFHHIDPTKKSFEISESIYSWKKTILELEKCALLCTNCHAEAHSGMITSEELIKNESRRSQKICNTMS